MKAFSLSRRAAVGQVGRRILAARHLVLAAAVVTLLAGASNARTAPRTENFSLSPSAIQVNPKRPTIVYASTLDRGVIKSADGGQTWTVRGTLLPARPASRVDALAIDPRSPNVVFAGTGLGVFKTTDGARTWKLVNTGIDFGGDPFGHRMLEGFIWAIAIDPLHPSTVYAAGGGLWKSTNGGATWARVLDIGHRPVNVAVDPRRPDTVYASGMKWWRSRPTRNSIYKTADGGGRWRSIGPTDLHDASFGHPIGVDRLSRGTVYAGGAMGLFTSLDGGGTWSRQLSPGSAAGSINAIALDPLRANTLYVGGENGIVKSEDGGQTWSELPLDMRNVRTIAIAPKRPQAIYAGGDGMLKSTDGGTTWHRLG